MRKNKDSLRILFICGSLEPGKDGVGDYVRLLAAEIALLDHLIYVVAFNDRYVKEIFEETIVTGSGHSIAICRLPSIESFDNRSIFLKKEIRNFDPSWISLQYVPYGYHKKGLPFKFTIETANIIGDRNCQIMLHELWIDDLRSAKDRVIALLQRHFIAVMLSSIPNKMVHVSTPFNQLRIRKLGFKGKILTLFGNIRKADQVTEGGNKSIEGKKLIYFGAAPSELVIDKILQGITEYLNSGTDKITLILIGSDSAKKQHFINRLSVIKTPNFEILNLGFMNESDVSKVMLESHVGIVRSEPKFLGKSGTAYAMLEHGLPVWVPLSNPKRSITFPFRSQLIYKNLNDAINSNTITNYESRLPLTARELVEQWKSSGLC